MKISEEEAVNILDNLKERTILTSLEVDLSNLCIKYRQKIKELLEKEDVENEQGRV